VKNPGEKELRDWFRGFSAKITNKGATGSKGIEERTTEGRSIDEKKRRAEKKK